MGHIPFLEPYLEGAGAAAPEMTTWRTPPCLCRSRAERSHLPWNTEFLPVMGRVGDKWASSHSPGETHKLTFFCGSWFISNHKQQQKVWLQEYSVWV